ncbi:MAG: Maf family protein [Candidatus Electrothrix sp. YB6]
MFLTRKPLILASASPRRQQLLRDLGIDFTVLPADINETPQAGETSAGFALRMAEEKTACIARQHPAAWVIGADTVVTFDGRILGKPADAAHALKMLRSLRGRTHQVITGLALACMDKNRQESLTRTTEVSFADVPDAVLSAYIRTGEPLDKAGAYGIQAKGGFLVRSITGSCTNVIGLPLSTCISLLLQCNIITPVQQKK